MHMGQRIRNLLTPVHGRFRAQKLYVFFQELKPRRGETLLDVGGNLGVGGEFEPLYNFFEVVQIVNLDPAASAICGQLRHVKVTLADGCALPFADRSYDWVFSNAVIEHVGGAHRQKQFASEILRVARKGYFVATPNRNFPVEPHTLLPFYQFLGVRMQKWVCRYSPGYVREYEQIDLLSPSSLRRLFPSAIVRGVGLPLLPNNLVVYGSLSHEPVIRVA